MTPTSAVIIGGSDRVSISEGASRTNIGGVLIPAGVAIGKVSPTSDGTIVSGIDRGVLDDLVNKYSGDDASSSSSAAGAAKTLREILDGMLDGDRKLDDDAEERVQCVICFDRVKCIALDPCGHVETCARCTLELVKDDKEIECPICKEKAGKVAFARVV
jgi:hypothetical protein